MALPIFLRSWRTKSLTSVVQVTPEGIFNANRCGVYCNLLYDKTWTLKGGTCKCLNINKKRIIIIPVCGNMAGSEKFPPSFVGKTKYPFNLNSTKSLPCTYHHIGAAWVICKIALNFWSLSTDKWHQWRGQYFFLLISASHTQGFRKFAKCPNWVSFFCKHIITVASRPGYYQGCKQNLPRSLVFETAAKIEAKWRLLQIIYAWCCHHAINCMELSYTRNHCWLFCESWILCICSSKWTRLWWWRQWQQQCGW